MADIILWPPDTLAHMRTVMYIILVNGRVLFELPEKRALEAGRHLRLHFKPKHASLSVLQGSVPGDGLYP